MTVAVLLVTMLAMVLAAELFTNAVEWFGHRLRVGEGVVGSVLAAVGTALPETLVPLVAIVKGGEAAHAVSVGAILGAPFMLSTLAFGLAGLAVLLFRGIRSSELLVAPRITSRDLSWFIPIFSGLLFGSLVPSGWPRVLLAAGLLAAYAKYVADTLGASVHKDEALRRLYLGGAAPSLVMILTQLLLAIVALMLAAHTFVGAVENLAAQLRFPLLVLSLLVVPVATELPEKVNSILWIARRKDTLALGNITGAMVFQAAIPGAVGLLFTDWALDSSSWLTAGFTLISAIAVWSWLNLRGKFPAAALLPGGALYGTYVILVLLTRL